MCSRTLFSLVAIQAMADEVQKFLTFNFIIFRVDSLRAGGWWCSLEPVQLLQLSRKMWRMVKNVAALHSALTSSLCILCNNSNLQLGTILWFHQKHVAWTLATIARIAEYTDVQLGAASPCSPAPRLIV